MHIRKLKIFSFICLTSILLYEIKPVMAQQEEPKNILVIFSMNQGVVAYQLILENFKNVLREEYNKPFKLFIEYLDVGKFPNISYQQFLFDQINAKYNNINLDLVVCVGPSIITYIDNYAAQYLKEIPAISLDFKDPFDPQKKYSLNSKTTQILAEVDAKSNFELAFKLFPNHNSVYVISGSAKVDNFLHRIVMSAAGQYEKSKKIYYWSDITMEVLLEEAPNIPDESIIIIPSFSKDALGTTYNTAEVIRLVAQKTKAPIFVLLDTPFGEGAFGGYVSSMKFIGIKTGKAAIKILNGNDPQSVVVDDIELNRYMFDWKELNKWQLLNSDLIPENSIILNEEIVFIDKYKWALLAGILFLIFQSLLIANLFRLNKKQRIMTHQIIESETKYRELVREDRLQRMAELTASLSHELNQPLTAILSGAQAGIRFINSNRANQETIKELFQNIVEDDKRAASIISSVRSMMKLEKREKEKVELNSLINEVVQIFKGEASKQKIRLEIDLQESPVFIFADLIQIQQVLLNFLFNASHAMEGVDPQKKIIRISETLSDSSVTIKVRDYGIGIKKEIKETIFKPFTTTRDNGFGIGLAISKSIIEAHKGKISAENNPDAGATFTFELKLWEDEK